MHHHYDFKVCLRSDSLQHVAALDCVKRKMMLGKSHIERSCISLFILLSTRNSRQRFHCHCLQNLHLWQTTSSKCLKCHLLHTNVTTLTLHGDTHISTSPPISPNSSAVGLRYGSAKQLYGWFMYCHSILMNDHSSGIEADRRCGALDADGDTVSLWMFPVSTEQAREV